MLQLRAELSLLVAALGRRVSDCCQRPQLSLQDHAAGPRRSVHSARQQLEERWPGGRALGWGLPVDERLQQ